MPSIGTRPNPISAWLQSYEAVAEDFTRAPTPGIGPRTVLKWARGLSLAASILDLRVRPGTAISKALLQAGYKVHGVGRLADPRLEVPRAVPGSVGGMQPCRGLALLGKVARALDRHGRFLFTSPK